MIESRILSAAFMGDAETVASLAAQMTAGERDALSDAIDVVYDALDAAEKAQL